MDGLLGGIRILDLADEKASFSTKLLADLGARVVKIEKPGGDPARKRAPQQEKSSDTESNLSFCYHNTNKLSITLNLESREGRQIFLKLAQATNAVVESFPPGHLEKLDLGFEALKKINPALVLVSVTGFGQTGLRSAYKSCDLIASAFGGQMYVTGSPDSEPLKLCGEQSYLTVSLYAAISILLTLRQRGKNQCAEHIDISLQEAVISSLEHVSMRFFAEKIISERQGSLHWNNFFYVFPCKDGFMQMTLFENWETLVEWLDSEGMAQDLVDEKYGDQTYRMNHVSHIIEVLRKWTMSHTTKDLFELGQLMRFPWAPVQTPKQITNCSQLEARKFFVDIAHPEKGDTHKYPRFPYLFSPPVATPYKRAPRVGEHNAQIYSEELGFSKNEVNRLSAKGVI